MRTAFGWYLLLLANVIVTPYLLGVPPRCRREWRCVTITLAFLTWLLLGLESVR